MEIAGNDRSHCGCGWLASGHRWRCGEEEPEQMLAAPGGHVYNGLNSQSKA
jgi:hypothetical protein